MEQKIKSRQRDKKHVDEIEVTSRLINIIFDMPIERQLELLKFLDSFGFNGGRRHDRTTLKNPWIVAIDPDEEPYDCYIKDVSRCGMFIETRRFFEAGEKIILKFQVPSSKKIFKLVGEVARIQNNGIGVKFKRQLL